MQGLKGYDSFLDVIGGSKEAGGLLRLAALAMPAAEKLTLAKQLFATAVRVEHDDEALTALQLVDRALIEVCKVQEVRSPEAEAGRRFRTFLDEVFWTVPYAKEYQRHGIESALVKTRLAIIRELIAEWKATELPETVHAFRRLIAMGWPVDKRYQQRNGESDVEMKARGRAVPEEERKAIVVIVREHMEHFAGYEEKKAGPDAVFGPWLAHSHVPDELRHMLVMARAKMGGEDLARRDIRNAEVLRGLPVDALNRLEDAIGPMRRMVAEAEELRQRVCAKMQERNRQWRQDMAPLGWSVAFPAVDHARIEIGPTGEVDTVFADAAIATTDLRQVGKLRACHLTVVVVESVWPAQDREAKRLVRDWRLGQE